MKFALAGLSILFLSSLSFAQGLTLEHNAMAIVVPGHASNCTDVRGGVSPVPTSLGPDFFKMNIFKLNWQGSNLLFPAALKITINHPYLENSPVVAYIAGQDLDYAFGAQSFSPGVIDMNDYSAGTACGIGIGGLKRLPQYQNASFSTDADIEFIGYSQDEDGSNAQAVHAASRIHLNFF